MELVELRGHKVVPLNHLTRTRRRNKLLLESEKKKIIFLSIFGPTRAAFSLRMISPISKSLKLKSHFDKKKYDLIKNVLLTFL